jgi:uncharacterized protein YndB with AHSA1/START domain/predicted enzyme related to lactoylglutathione lyase
MVKYFFIFGIILFHFILSSQNKMEISDKKIIKTRAFHQTLDSLWSRWTTHEGLKTFFGIDNKIELTPGGSFEIYFMMEKPYGLRGSESCKILSFLPGEFVSFSWNAPPQFPEVRNADYKTWVVVGFKLISETETEVRITHTGWPIDDKWLPVYDYFDKAWDSVLDNLSKLDIKNPLEIKPEKKATGIGGIFFKCKDPALLKEWYKQHLGLNTDQYGTSFEWRQGDDPSKYGFTQWSPFSATTKYFEPSTREFMINYRVENLEKLVDQLKKDGVIVTDEIESYDYGKFVHIMDIEGNKIELWEPVDAEYDKIVEGRTK